MAYTTVQITEGAGTAIAVDLISSQRFQRIKPTVGVEGVAVDDWRKRVMRRHRPLHGLIKCVGFHRWA